MAVKSSPQFNGHCQRRAAGGWRQVESHYNRPLISTTREHRRRAPCVLGGILKHTCKYAYTHTHTHKNCYNRQQPSGADWAHYIPPIPFPPPPSGSWPHSGSTPSHGGPCVSIQQSEKQQHQWAHIIIHLTAPRAWHLLTALLFCLSAALLPFSLHYSAQEKGCTVRGVGACLDSRGPHPHSGSQWQTSNMIGQGRQRGVWQENNLTIPGAWSILSSVCNTRYIK